MVPFAVAAVNCFFAANVGGGTFVVAFFGPGVFAGVLNRVDPVVVFPVAATLRAD